MELGAVGWFGGEWAPCLAVTTFENALVTSSLAGRLCAMNCKDWVQQLVTGRWPQGLCMLRTALLLAVAEACWD